MKLGLWDLPYVCYCFNRTAGTLQRSGWSIRFCWNGQTSWGGFGFWGQISRTLFNNSLPVNSNTSFRATIQLCMFDKAISVGEPRTTLGTTICLFTLQKIIDFDILFYMQLCIYEMWILFFVWDSKTTTKVSFFLATYKFIITFISYFLVYIIF